MKELTQFWLDRPHDAQKMWDSYRDPHRQQLLVALSLLGYVDTLHELGCGSGPNLRLVREVFPKIQLFGSEPNAELREFAERNFLVTASQLPDVDVSSCDVVLSMYTLAYVKDAKVVLEKLWDNANRLLVLIEPMAGIDPFEKPGLYQGHAMPSYVHDYVGLAETIGWRVLWRWPIIPHHQGLNCVLILSR